MGLPTTPATPAPPEGGSSVDLGGSYHLAALDSLLMSILSRSFPLVTDERAKKNVGAIRSFGKGERTVEEQGEEGEEGRFVTPAAGEHEGGRGRGEGRRRRKMERGIRNAAKNASLPEAWSYY